MVKNQGIDIVVGAATIEREKKYLPIRFPITKGLNGWRISLVNKNNINLFQNITSLTDFKKLIPGQHYTWSDSEIFSSNAITVMEGSSIDGLYSMLEKERFNYFPRSILEIDQDLADHNNLDIMIEPHIIIHYPIAYYFYVCKENNVLANDIEQGLEMALADGSFDEIFFKFHGEYIKKIQQSNRRVFKLNNSILPEKTPLNRKELWLDFNHS